MELTQQLAELTGVITTFQQKAQAELTTLGATTSGTAEKLIALQKQVDALDVKMTEKHAQGEQDVPLLDSLKDNTEIARLMDKKTGRATFRLTAKQHQQIFERKAVLASAAGFQATGVLPIERMPGITPEARTEILIRDLISARPTSLGVVDYVKVNAPLVAASPQVEGSSKYPNAVTFTSASERIKTIATYIDASRQILDDFAELQAFLQDGLSYYVDKAEQTELLSGSNTGEHLNGLITQASAFNGALLPAAGTYNRIDQIYRVKQQINRADEVPATFIVMHPDDVAAVRLTKDLYGRYILGDPDSGGLLTVWGLKVAETTGITAGTFLVGNGNPAAAQIRDRMETTIDISTENNDNFIKNMITIRVEKRLALVVRRPASFITGTFAQSPA